MLKFHTNISETSAFRKKINSEAANVTAWLSIFLDRLSPHSPWGPALFKAIVLVVFSHFRSHLHLIGSHYFGMTATVADTPVNYNTHIYHHEKSCWHSPSFVRWFDPLYRSILKPFQFAHFPPTSGEGYLVLLIYLFHLPNSPPLSMLDLTTPRWLHFVLQIATQTSLLSLADQGIGPNVRKENSLVRESTLLKQLKDLALLSRCIHPFNFPAVSSPT